MPIDVSIVNGHQRTLSISDEGQAEVVVHPHPPRNEARGGIAIPFRQYFTDDGTSSGSNDMIVNGSSTPQEFYIGAETQYDRYIKTISVEISDGGSPALNKFGDLSALTNGLSWSWFTQELGAYTLADSLKTNKDFVRLALGQPAFGDGANAFLADVSGGGTAKSYLPVMDIGVMFGLPWGIRLQKETTDKLIFTVNDNLAGLVTFNIIAYGIRW